MICYLLESSGEKTQWYIGLRKTGLGRGKPFWTTSPQEATRFVRHEDAELFQVLISSYLAAMGCKVVPHEFDDPAVVMLSW